MRREPAELLVGEISDDAVYRVADDVAIIETVDFFAQPAAASIGSRRRWQQQRPLERYDRLIPV